MYTLLIQQLLPDLGFILLGAVSSTLHQKVKYLSEGQIKEILGDQVMARQCIVAAIWHKPEAELSARGEKGL